MLVLWLYLEYSAWGDRRRRRARARDVVDQAAAGDALLSAMYRDPEHPLRRAVDRAA